MTEESNNVQDVTTSANGLGEDGKTDGSEMPENNQLAYETYKKALNQRHKFKSENEALRAELEAVKQRELEQEGKKDEALKYWKDKATKAEEQFKKSTAQFAWSQVQSQLTESLLKEGCVEPAVALSLIDKSELESVEVDDNYRVSAEDLLRITESVKRDQRAQKIRLFGGPVGVNDMVPSSGSGNVKSKSVDSMTKEELLEQLKG
jgi:hypothetical protein